VHGHDHGSGDEILAVVPDAVCSLDRDWRFTYLNAAAEQMLEQPAEKLDGRGLG
jgi:PAS domain-containing protein